MRPYYHDLNENETAVFEHLKSVANGSSEPFEYSNLEAEKATSLVERTIRRVLGSLTDKGYITIVQVRNPRLIQLLPKGAPGVRTSRGELPDSRPDKGADTGHDTGPDTMSAPTPEQMACECALELPSFYKNIKNIKESYPYRKDLKTIFDGSDVVDLTAMVHAAGLEKLVPFGRPEYFPDWRFDFSDFHKAMRPARKQIELMEGLYGDAAYHYFNPVYEATRIKFFVVSMVIELANFPYEMFFNPSKWDADGDNFKEQWEVALTGPIAACIKACAPEGNIEALGGRILYGYDPTRYTHVLDYAVKYLRPYVVKLLSREDTATKCYKAFTREFYDWAVKQTWVYSGLNRIRAQPEWLEGVWGPDLSQGLLCRERDGYLPRLSYTMVLLRNLAGITEIAQLLQTGGDPYSYGKCIAALHRLYSCPPTGQLEGLKTLTTAFAPYFPFFNRLLSLHDALAEHLPEDMRARLNLK